MLAAVTLAAVVLTASPAGRRPRQSYCREWGAKSEELVIEIKAYPLYCVIMIHVCNIRNRRYRFKRPTPQELSDEPGIPLRKLSKS